MNAFRNLFPHPYTLFPTRSRQSRTRSGNRIRNPRISGWRFYRESEDSSPHSPGNMPGTSRNAPRVQLRQKRRSGDDRGFGDEGLGENDNNYGKEGGGMSGRGREEEGFLGRSRREGVPKRWSGLGMDGCGRVEGILSRENERERERETKRELQRSIEEIMDIKENVLRELEVVEDEWRCIERAWEVLEENMHMDRENNMRDRGLNGLSEDRGMFGSNRNGRRYIRWNEGIWENMDVNSREMGGLF